MNNNDLKYLTLLSKEYKNIVDVSEEIINLQAILNLPKGTELFLSDIHGEYEFFTHILKNACGVIKSKIENIFGNSIPELERKNLATLIYYPEEKLALIKKNCPNLQEWYNITLYRLIQICKEVASKYTRSKVKKALPKGFDYIINELLNLNVGNKDKERYYSQIISTIIEIDRADAFIIALSQLISRLAIDHLHILGDIYDRGLHPEKIMDVLMDYHSLDITWGNHDILWMGSASGNLACIANVLRWCARYNTLSILEEGYGINIRPLSTFAMEKYKDDLCDNFISKSIDSNNYNHFDKLVISKIHKAITIIQLKLEGQAILNHPKYKMENRLLLDKINYESGIINIDGKYYTLNDTNFPTVNPKDPYKLSHDEAELMERLKISFLNSEKLQKHVGFLFSKGQLYNVFNSNLLFHGCVPMDSNGEFTKINLSGEELSGKKYFDYIDSTLRKAYAERTTTDYSDFNTDIFWYLWCSPNSPVFGKEKAATFERYFINDNETHHETKNPYYTFIENEETCNKIFNEFNLDNDDSHIINGHMPVKTQNGESPLRANGKLLLIDGGLAKSYRKETGIAGYNLTYNSHGLLLSANEPFESKAKAIENGTDIISEIIVRENVVTRKLVADTDIGKKIKEEVEDLKNLLNAYKTGLIKETL